MRVLIAPLEFKGTLSASEAARAIAAGLGRGNPALHLTLLPWADGGPGTLDLLLAQGGRRRTVSVQDPLGRPCSAQWGERAEGKVALLEMAEASGLHRLLPFERDALRASSFGTGELIRAALDAGFRNLLLGVGGSATTDGGSGALTALGARFLDVAGRPLPPGGAALNDLASIDLSSLDPRLGATRLVVLADVLNSLLGPKGAARLFSPQKGATEAEAATLESGLARLAEVIRRAGFPELAEVPGAGAAGGLAFGLMALAQAQVAPAFETLAVWAGLDAHLAECEVLITGEGQLDAQTTLGKGPLALARRARGLGRRAILFTGRVAPGAQDVLKEFDAVLELPREPPQAAVRLRDLAADWARRVR